MVIMAVSGCGNISADYDLDKSQSFFPFVHMAPLNNGSLLVALLYLIEKRFGEQVNDPRELLESVAAANLYMFAISAGSKGKNHNYAGRREKVAASIPFFQADPRCVRRPWLFRRVRC